jgi:hypothetical protein
VPFKLLTVIPPSPGRPVLGLKHELNHRPPASLQFAYIR